MHFWQSPCPRRAFRRVHDVRVDIALLQHVVLGPGATKSIVTSNIIKGVLSVDAANAKKGAKVIVANNADDSAQ